MYLERGKERACAGNRLDQLKDSDLVGKERGGDDVQEPRLERRAEGGGTVLQGEEKKNVKGDPQSSRGKTILSQGGDMEAIKKKGAAQRLRKVASRSPG